MSEGERKLVDTAGDYLYAVKDRTPVEEPDWRSCRIVLTDERLVLSTNDGKQSVRHAKITVLEAGESVVPDAFADEPATPLRIGNTVILVDATGVDDFEREYCRAAIQDEVILVKYPAVVGGVIQGAEWQPGRLQVTRKTIRMVLEDGQKFIIERDDIGDLETDERAVAGEQRSVVEVEHSDDDRTSVETHLSGRQHHLSVLRQLLAEGAERNRADLDLGPTEKRVVVALYSGVSPFAISDFVGIDVEQVEEIYDELIELDVIEVVRERREVTLTPQGRKVAGEEMGKQ